MFLTKINFQFISTQIKLFEISIIEDSTEKEKKEIALKINDLKEKDIVGKKILAEKRNFDKLSYPEKISFWDNLGLDFGCGKYEIFKTREDEKKEKSISICNLPQLNEERKIYFDWFKKNLEITQPLVYDLEKIKENYFKKIKGNPQAVNFTKTQLAIYNTQKEDEFNISERSTFMKRHNGYKLGFKSILYNEEVDIEEHPFAIGDIWRILRGTINAQITPFLEEQLIILEEEKKKPKKEIEEIEEVTGIIQQRVAWLNAIGVIDFLKEKNKIQSSTTIAKILSKGIGKPENMKGELWDAIRKAIDRIEKENLLAKYNNYIDNTCQQLKIDRIK